MQLYKTPLEGVMVLIPEKIEDERGYFQETFNNHNYIEILEKLNDPFVQDNESCSKKGVIRGMHWQIPPMDQSKLVRCLQGKIIDIVVDIRHGSPTFREYCYIELTPENNCQVFIPKGFAHGFISLEDNSILSYKVDNYYSKEHERSFNIFSLNIKDIVDEDMTFILSKKDNEAPEFNKLNLEDIFIFKNKEENNGETGSNYS